MQSRFTSMAGPATGSNVPWWFVMIAGIAVFITGLLLVISPGMTLLLLVQLLGAYWLVTGILSLVSLCVDRSMWGLKLISGILGVIAGLIVLRNPLWSTLLVPTVLVIFVAVEALIMGFAQIIHAFSGGGFGLVILGILNVIFGMLLLFNPLIGVFALPIVLGIFAIVGGILTSVGAFAARNQQASAQPRSTQPA